MEKNIICLTDLFINARLMKTFLGAVCLLIPLPAISESNQAFVIIKATVADAEAKQPTWFGLSRYHHDVHIPANRSIVPIKPGTYRFRHIDFGKSENSGTGTQIFRDNNKLRFEADHIYFIGHFKLTKPQNEYVFELVQDQALILEACLTNPELFERYPLANPTNSNKFMVNCKQTIERSSK